MLVIWTLSTDTVLLTQIFKPILRALTLEHRFSRAETLQGVEALEGDTLLVLGTTLAGRLADAGLVPKNRTVASLREKPIPYGGITCFVSYDPAVVDLDATSKTYLWCDIQLAIRFAVTGTADPIIGSYGWVDDFSTPLAELLKAREESKQPQLVCLDLETIGLDEFAPEARILTISITTRAGVSYVYRVPATGVVSPQVIAQLKDLCQSADFKMTGANLKFDARWIKRHCGFWISNQTFDTTLVGSILDENRSNSLNLHAKLFTSFGGYDDIFNKTHDKSRMDLALEADPEGFLTYAGGDTDACFQVTGALREELLADQRLANFYIRVLQPATNAFAKMEHRGVLVDHARYLEVEQEVIAKKGELEQKIFKLFPAPLLYKYRSALSLSRPAILRDFMFGARGLNLEPKVTTAKTGEPATTIEHFEMFADYTDAQEFVALLTEYNSAAKTLSTFVTGFMSHIRSDGRFHPSYSMFRGDYGGGNSGGTVTGRTACNSPSWQQLPARTIWAKPLRSVYVPPPGYGILKADYSQGELRVTACVANEPTMIKVYKDGLDLHLVTGCQVHGITLAQGLQMQADEDPLIKQIRQGGKAGNFGLIYGMSAFGFQQYARKSYGVELSMQQAEEFRDGYFTTYSRLAPWHTEAIATARKDKAIRSPLGRLRHLPLIRSSNQEVRSGQERMAINCLSDDTEILTVRGWKTVDEVTAGTEIFSVNANTGRVEQDQILEVHTGQVDGEMYHVEHAAISAIATPNHRWLVNKYTRKGYVPRFRESHELSMWGNDKIWVSGLPLESTETQWSDDEVALIGWVLTDGHYPSHLSKTTGVDYRRNTVGVSQSKPQNLAAIGGLFSRLGKHSAAIRKTGQHVWTLTGALGARIRTTLPAKTLSTEFLLQLTEGQRHLLFDTMLLGDGCWDSHAGRYRKFCAGSKDRADAFLVLCALIGQSARAIYRDTTKVEPKKYASMGNIPHTEGHWLVELAVNQFAQPQYGLIRKHWAGRVWCPSTRNQTWIAKRNGKVFVTGNSPIQCTLSDFGLMAIAILAERYPDLWVFGFTHDSLECYVPLDDVEGWALRIKEVMENLPLAEYFGWSPQVPFTADVEFSPVNMSECAPLKLVA